MHNKYPEDEEVKVQWTTFHKLTLIVLTISLMVFLGCLWKNNSLSETLLFNAFGIYLSAFGSIFLTLKTPFYGTFYDGGRIEQRRQQVEAKYFRLGVFILLIGASLLLLGLT